MNTLVLWTLRTELLLTIPASAWLCQLVGIVFSGAGVVIQKVKYVSCTMLLVLVVSLGMCLALKAHTPWTLWTDSRQPHQQTPPTSLWELVDFDLLAQACVLHTWLGV